MRLYHDPYSKAFTQDTTVSASKPCLRNNTVLRNATNFQRNKTKTQVQSDAVNKRKKELEQLRSMSLTKDIATRLRNAEAPSESNLRNFAERQREKVRLEKEKLREAKSYLNNYRADGNKLSKFTESRRKSLEQEKAELEKARNYMNNYHGAEVDGFAERRRKSLLLERSKLKEAKDYMNNYRGDGNLPTSCRRNSTGSKASRVFPHSKNPKQLFSPINGRNPLEIPYRKAPQSARKDEKSIQTNTFDESREPCSNHKINTMTKRSNCNQTISINTKPKPARKNLKGIDKTNIDETREPCSNDSTRSETKSPNYNPPLSYISFKRNELNNSTVGVGSEIKSLPTGEESSIWKNALQDEYLFNVDAPIRRPNTCDHVDPHWDFLAILLGLDSSVQSDLNDEYKIFFGVGIKDNFVPSNQHFPLVFNENDPYHDTSCSDRCAQTCERFKDKACFGWKIM